MVDATSGKSQDIAEKKAVAHSAMVKSAHSQLRFASIYIPFLLANKTLLRSKYIFHETYFLSLMALNSEEGFHAGHLPSEAMRLPTRNNNCRSLIAPSIVHVAAL